MESSDTSDFRALAACLGRPALLVSVRNAAEARQAVVGGCDVLDVKEPARGPLGLADATEIEAIVRVRDTVDPRVPVSVALGEACEWSATSAASGCFRQTAALGLSNAEGTHSARAVAAISAARVAAVKLGTSAIESSGVLQELLTAVRRQIELDLGRMAAPLWIAVAYADWQAAAGPEPAAVLNFAATHGWGLLIDTFSKTSGSLLERLPVSDLQDLRAEARARGVSFALAGRLSAEAAPVLRRLAPDVVGIRSAACRGGVREREVDSGAVAAFSAALCK